MRSIGQTTQQCPALIQLVEPEVDTWYSLTNSKVLKAEYLYEPRNYLKFSPNIKQETIPSNVIIKIRSMVHNVLLKFEFNKKRIDDINHIQVVFSSATIL